MPELNQWDKFQNRQGLTKHAASEQKGPARVFPDALYSGWANSDLKTTMADLKGSDAASEHSQTQVAACLTKPSNRTILLQSVKFPIGM
jgi:hypothetical protein